MFSKHNFKRIEKASDVAIYIMPLGDSITVGSHSGVAQREFQVAYCKALWDKLVAAGYYVDFVGSQIAGDSVPKFDPQHETYSGMRADEIAVNVFNWLSNSPADIVLLHIGTNDITGFNEEAN